MLRILTLSTLFPDASRPNFGVFVEAQTLALAARADCEVRVVAPVGVPPWPLSTLPRYRALTCLPAREEWKGLDVTRPHFLNLPGMGGRLHPAMLEQALLPLLRRIRRDYPFDILAAEFFFPDGPAAVALGRRLGVPVSIKARGWDIHHWGRARATAAQVLRAGREADGMLAVSREMRADMIALGMPGDRIEPSYTGVDLAALSPTLRAGAKQALGIAAPLVVSVGALIPRKGHAIVVDAVARLSNVQLRIVGEGPERQRLEQQIARLGIEDRVHLLGSVPHADIARILAAADVMALASASEGLANAWVEALACGTPIVIPDVGGAREVVTGPEVGRIAARSAPAFAEAIAELIAASPSPDGPRDVAERFTWPANAAHLVDFYQRILATHATAAHATGTGVAQNAGVQA